MMPSVVKPGRIGRGSHGSLRSAAYEALREGLMTGQLPPGEQISLVDVPRRFGVGHSAVREALCRLAADGMVIAEDQRGFSAAPVSSEDLVDLTVARVEIESFALRDAIARGDLRWEAQIQTTFDTLTSMRRAEGSNPRTISNAYRLQHRAFHESLVAACSSEWIKRFRRTLHDHSDRYRQLAVTAGNEQRSANVEHRNILEATLSRDADRAVSLMIHHIEETARVLIRVGIAGAHRSQAAK